MSVRHLNYTGRKRIDRAHVKIAIAGEPPDASVVGTFDLAEYNFPGPAHLVLEAQAGWTMQRFDFGTIAERRPPANARLTEFSTLAGLLFRFKVVGVGSSEGKLLGEAERLRPSSTNEEASQRSFIAVRSSDLGQLPWKVSIADNQPLLHINERLGDHHDFLRRKEVVGLVLPAVLQHVMIEAIERGVDEDDSSTWEAQAINLGETLAGTPAPNADDHEAVEVWIESALAEFARRHRLLDGVIELLGRPDE